MGILVLPACHSFYARVPDALLDECNPSPSCSGRAPISRGAGLRNAFSRRGRRTRRLGFVLHCSGFSPDSPSNGDGDGDGEEEEQESKADENAPGFWESEENKKKLDEIQQMQELVAEAERLEKELEGDTKERAAKFQEELARRAKEQAQQRKQAAVMFDLGQRAYGKGSYGKAVEFLEAALTNVPKASNLGGEIQIWLAMAYEAHNRHDDCISLYKRLESSHPNKAIRRQAADLRYILEAPKLKISSNERVTIPLIDAYSQSSQKTWSQMARERKQRLASSSGKKSQKKSEDWIEWNPPKWEKSPYFWVAVTVWLTLAGISLMFQD
ncbi:hypothetical protein SELMODRAFT_439621 [Selaginella moellendorffii]|uniref:Uncharacterized protein n=1 Tax=Selaginella moellendorffii TaxID=88036 RepID=D8R6I2_SELML|nr:uncharacterized protein LOC9633730 [Selaginella moellendorffii]EFJ32316.1 hypothetical protein SELMODRAFT_439621 [Selaginella moellendorffii]|eukprot:XP_002966289.1 uncharacterized protein LOC9633730 [Selaginella moellendorffii]